MIRHIILIILFAIPAIGFPYTINFSKGIDPTSIDRLHPKLKDIALFIAGFCEQNRVKFVVTSTIRSLERNKQVRAKSLTHVEGRAFDFSLREEHGWTQELVMLLFIKINERYGHLGAYSTNGKQVIMFNHEGDSKEGAYHSHVQVHKLLSWE